MDADRAARLDRLAARRQGGATPRHRSDDVASSPTDLSTPDLLVAGAAAPDLLPPPAATGATVGPTAPAATSPAPAPAPAANRRSRRGRPRRRHAAGAARILAAGTSGSMFLGIVAALAANPPSWSSAESSESTTPEPTFTDATAADTPAETTPAAETTEWSEAPPETVLVPPLDPSLGAWVPVPVEQTAGQLPPEGAPPVPETIVVVETIHRTVYVDEQGNPVAPPGGQPAPTPTSPNPSPAPPPTTRPSGGGTPTPTTRPPVATPPPTTRPPVVTPPPTTKPPTTKPPTTKPPACTGSKC